MPNPLPSHLNQEGQLLVLTVHDGVGSTACEEGVGDHYSQLHEPQIQAPDCGELEKKPEVIESQDGLC